MPNVLDIKVSILSNRLDMTLVFVNACHNSNSINYLRRNYRIIPQSSLRPPLSVIRPSVTLKSTSGKTSVLDAFLGMRMWGDQMVWMGVGRPCPPVRNDIVTPRHYSLVLSRNSLSEKIVLFTSTIPTPSLNRNGK